MVQLGSESAGHEVTAQVGEQIALVLTETGSTGYRWHLANACPEVLSAEEDESRPGEVERPGAAGEHRWVFLAKAMGHCELRVELARSWEPQGAGKVLLFPIKVVGR